MNLTPMTTWGDVMTNVTLTQEHKDLAERLAFQNPDNYHRMALQDRIATAAQLGAEDDPSQDWLGAAMRIRWVFSDARIQKMTPKDLVMTLRSKCMVDNIKWPLPC